MSGPLALGPFAPFDPSDAWLLQAVLYAGGMTEGAELRDVIALGDGLEDALFTAEELKGGFARLTAAGFVRASSGRYFVVGNARRLGESEMPSFREHREAIAAFLAASDYRGIDSEEIDPDLTDERIGQAVEAYLAPFREGPGEPDSPADPPTDPAPSPGPNPEPNPEEDPTTVH